MIARLECGDIIGFEDYSAHVKEFHTTSDWIDLIEMEAQMRKLEYGWYRDTKTQEKEMSMIDKLKQYTQDFPSDVDIRHIEQILIETQHIAVYHSFVDLFLLKSDKKRFTLWVDGDSNTGKTEMLLIIDKIFYCYSYMETNSHFCVKIFRKEFKTQIVLVDEGAKKSFLNNQTSD